MKNLEDNFVPYNEALELKKLGFDEPCFGWYNWTGEDLSLTDNSYVDINPTPAPIFSQSFEFFREKYKLDSHIKHLYQSIEKVGYYYNIDKYKGIEYSSMKGSLDYGYYKTYKEAELECLRKLILIANETQKSK